MPILATHGTLLLDLLSLQPLLNAVQVETVTTLTRHCVCVCVCVCTCVIREKRKAYIYSSDIDGQEITSSPSMEPRNGTWQTLKDLLHGNGTRGPAHPPRAQSSPGNLQSGQQPTNGRRHIPHSVSSLGVIHFHTATAVHFLNFTFKLGEEEVGVAISVPELSCWRITNSVLYLRISIIYSISIVYGCGSGCAIHNACIHINYVYVYKCNSLRDPTQVMR